MTRTSLWMPDFFPRPALVQAACVGLLVTAVLPRPVEAQSVFGRLHVSNGMTWIDPAGVPYTGSASFALGWSLGDPAVRHEQNLLFGPVIGARYTRRGPAVGDVEGTFGLRVSGRVLRTIIPVDILWGVDAAVGTRPSVPIGVSVGAGNKQALAGFLRFAYDFKNTEPLLEFNLSVPLFSLGGKAPPSCDDPDLGDVRTDFTARLAQEAYTDQVFRRLSPPPAELPANLPSSVTDLASFVAFMTGRVDGSVLTSTHLTALVNRARPPAGGGDDRQTAEAILLGWRERLRIRRCSSQ